MLHFRDITNFSSVRLQYSYVALTMLPFTSDSVARSRHTKHNHTSSRFRDRGNNPNSGRFGGQSPHRGRVRYLSVAVLFDSAQHSRYTHHGPHIFEVQEERDIILTQEGLEEEGVWWSPHRDIARYIQSKYVREQLSHNPFTVKAIL